MRLRSRGPNVGSSKSRFLEVIRPPPLAGRMQKLPLRAGQELRDRHHLASHGRSAPGRNKRRSIFQTAGFAGRTAVPGFT